MKNKLRFGLSVALLWAATSSLPSTLLAAQLGDAAPPIHVSEWIQGSAPDLAAGQIRLVYFWSTTQRTSRDGLVPLAALEKELRPRLQVLAISDQEPATVRVYMKNFTKGMEFAVGIDDHKKTFQDYVGGFGATLDSVAFLVDGERRVVWFGEPAAAGEVARKVLDGTFKVEAAQKKIEYHRQAQELLNDYFSAIMSGVPKEHVEENVTKLFDMGREFPEALTALARGILIVPGLKERDFATGLRAAKQAREALGPKDFDANLYYAKTLIELGSFGEASEVLKAMQANDMSADQRRSVVADIARCKEAIEKATKGGDPKVGEGVKPDATGGSPTTRGSGPTTKPRAG